MYSRKVPTGTEVSTVQKVLLSMILALFMALALVGVKRIFTPAGSSKSAVLIADGGMPAPGSEVN